MKARWASGREHGSSSLIRLIIWLTLRLGRPVGQALLYPVTAYFVAALPRARRASRDYLARVLGRPARPSEIWRHFFTFACVILDRVSFLAGRTTRFHVRVSGFETLVGAVEAGRGCILLGSHLGSFEVLRVLGRQSPVPVKTLMYRGATGALSHLIEALDPELRRHVIEIGSPDAMLRVRESLARGEVVGILADRAPSTRRSAMVDFLGAPAALPTGPIALAASLDVPVVLFFGLRIGPRDYRIVLERFADRITLGPGGPALREWTARYAERLATHCHAHPFNWFNFYDFWEQQRDATASAGSGRAAARGRRRRGDTAGARTPGVASGAD